MKITETFSILIKCVLSSTLLSAYIFSYAQGSGNALDFDGSNDRVLISDDAVLDIQEAITIEFWFLLEGNGSTNNSPRVVSKGQTSNSNGAYGVFVKDVTDPVTVAFRFIDAGGTNRTTRSNSVPNYDDGEWHHVAGTYSNSEDLAVLYVDGVVEATSTITGNTLIRTTADDLTLGAGVNNRFFNGKVDDVRIWNVSRSKQEIREFMCSKLAGTETGLVGYWNFDNASTGAGNVEDLTSNNLDGTMTNMNAADILTSGAPIGDESIHSYPQDWSGNCLEFDGTNDYVDIGDVLIDGTSAVTIEAWIFPTSFPSNGSPSGHNSNEGGIIHKNGGSDDNIGLTVSTSGLAFYVDNGSNNTVVGALPAIRTWTHVAATYDGTDLVIYQNGVLDVTKSSVGSGNFVNNTNSLRIGGAHVGGGNPFYFTGRIDEVRVWNYARTADEITNDMCRPLEGNETGLTGYWRFDELTGSSTASDAVGSNDGTLTNMNVSADWVDAAHSCSLTGFELYMESPDNDSLRISSISGSPDGVHIYYVNTAPNTLTGTLGVGSNDIYYGVWSANGTSPTYTATYYYNENDAWQNPENVLSENDLLLYARDDNSGLTWVDQTAAQNLTENTLTEASKSNAEFILGISNLALPIELISFNAIAENEYVKLIWSTTSEINNNYFTIEKTVDGKNWTEVAKVDGAGNSYVKLDYQALDPSPFDGVSYYRLKQNDFDGQFSYSENVIVKYMEHQLFSLFPNPTDGYIEVNSDFLLPSEIQVFNSLGQNISKLIRTLNQSSNNILLDLKHVPAGMYYLYIQNKSYKVVKR